MLVCIGFSIGFILSADNDLKFLKNISWPGHIIKPDYWLEIAHAHLGVLGILNIVLSLVELKKRWLYTGIFIGSCLVPAGFIFYLAHPLLLYITPVGSFPLLACIILVALEKLRSAT